jgi:DNA/RNA endonuclease G (NUC1)
MHTRNWRVALLALTLAVGSCSDSGVIGPLGRSGPKVADATALAEVSAAEAVAQIIITELMPDPAAFADASGEWFEVFNAGPTEVDLEGWRVESNADGGFTITTSVKVPSGGYATFANGLNPGFTPSYTYANNQTTGIVLANTNANEFIRLKDAGGMVIDEVRFAAGTNADGTPAPVYAPQAGRSREVVDITVQNTFVGGKNWRVPTSQYGPIGATVRDFGTPGTGHYVVGEVGPVATVTVTPSSATIFRTAQQQFSAAAFDAAGNRVTTATFTWTSTENARVDAPGVVTGLQPGDATITATADGTITAAVPAGIFGTAPLHIDELPPEPVGPKHISEVHYDNTGADADERIEIEGPAGLNVTGWSLILYTGSSGSVYNTIGLGGVIPATESCGTRGVLSFAVTGLQNGGSTTQPEPDGIALVNAVGAVVEFISYEGTFKANGGPADGMTSTDIGFSQNSAPFGQSLQRDAEGWYGQAAQSFGACNVAPPPALVLFGRTPSDAPLPVGFEDQLFARLRNRGVETTPTVTWSSETPGLASIDQRGVMRALGAGTATLRATMAGGMTEAISLPTRVAVASTTAQYAGNAEFGEPKDGNASDDIIVRRDQYTASYNPGRGIPNWVSYNLEVTHFGPEDRCDCFTFDPILEAAGFPRYTTADYTDAGDFHGYGIDRGHLARSFDRTSASLDNATTFYFTNIIPQASAVNQGPWADMENDLGNLARSEDKEVYIVTGASGSKGTVKNEKKITIPARVWKVAVIMPRNQGLTHIDSYDDLEIVAVNMPNDPDVDDDWTKYITTVDAVEALSGYDLLALLPDRIEVAVETGLQRAFPLVDGLAAGRRIDAERAKWLTNKLELAVKHLAENRRTAGINQLDEIIRELDRLVRSGHLGAADAAPLRTLVNDVIRSL